MSARFRSCLAHAPVVALTIAFLSITSALHAQTVTLTWNANTEADLAGYMVLYGTQTGIYENSVVVGKVTSETVTGLAGSTTYYFTVKAYNTAGRLSGTSNEVFFTTAASGDPPPSTGLTLTSVSPNSGPMVGGTAVTLTGSGFVSGAQVYIGPTLATGVTFVSATQLTATTPAGSLGAQVVTVVNPDTQGTTLSNGFTYTAAVPTPDDTDGDGLPNAWEEQWGLDPNSGVGDDGPTGDPDHDGVTNIAEYQAHSHPRGFVKRYFAEGAVNAFFDTRFALANPQAVPAHVLLEFLDIEGQTRQRALVLPARSRTTVVARDIIPAPGTSFSTRVESDQVVVADRLMRWEATFYGSHAETAVSEPSTKWYFAEGATSGPYQLFYLLQNPNDQTANVQIRYLRSDGAPVVKTYQVTPRSRANVYVNLEPDLKDAEVSAEITANLPIIAERSMYFNGPLPYWGGHGSAGVTAPSKNWFLAEGATGSFFTMFVLIGNPSNEDAQVKVTYLLSEGAPVVRTYSVRANSRVSINVNGEPGLADVAVASHYESNVPIIVERTMWWPGSPDRWTEGHNSFGVTSTGTKWVLAEGEQGGAQNTVTYVLIANTSAFDGEAKVTLLFEDAPEVSRIVPLRANSRVNVPMDGPFAVANGKRFATIVETIGSTPAQIVVERAMYSDSRGDMWGAGSNAVATKIQ